MTSTPQDEKSSKAAAVAAYNAFVRRVNPVSVRLLSLHLGADPFTPGDTKALISGAPPRYEPRVGGFTAIQPFKLEGTARDGARLSLEFELAVDYDSPIEVTPELFDVFGRVNLPLNAHPFIRETVASITTRAGWPPLVLSAFVKPGESDSPPEG